MIGRVRRWWRWGGVTFVVFLAGALGFTPGTSEGMTVQLRPVASDTLMQSRTPTWPASAAYIRVAAAELAPSSAQPATERSSGGPAPSSSVVTQQGTGDAGYFYLPGGRRDPFAAIVEKPNSTGQANLDLPPLQRVSLPDLNLIGIMWGGFGYVAVVQTPDGKGYTIRRGTRVGPNKGVVRAITEKAVIVEERFTDVYGTTQVREFVKALHGKERPE
ncbi:pilus assembly protein PilP [Nitrospiraceae bacterium AH_259_D15_M11_P09]|nr:pilus assembly protein PilP [Nitrospiraceae bacterium AH_259_D15_M11_P09]